VGCRCGGFRGGLRFLLRCGIWFLPFSGGGDRCSSALDRTRFEVCLTFLLLVFSNSHSRFGHFLLVDKIEMFTFGFVVCYGME
jgi:hypothetical protein